MMFKEKRSLKIKDLRVNHLKAPSLGSLLRAKQMAQIKAQYKYTFFVYNIVRIGVDWWYDKG